MQQLLYLEIILKGSIGLALMLAPGAVIKILGLPTAPTGFWPRMLGAALLGTAAASLIEGTLMSSRGLGLAGSLVINFVAVAMLITLLALNAAATTVRGRVLLWIVAACLCVLILVEIAYV